jgi:fatty acid kinase fatty acid binding subunit
MIVVVTDSTPNISQEVKTEYGIEMIPTYVHFGSKTYLDVVELKSSEFYKLLVESKEQPTTSQLSVLDFSKFYKQIHEKNGTAQILSLHVSSILSGTIESARQGAASIPDATILLFDTRSVALGHGLMVRQAAEMARKGIVLSEIIKVLSNMRDNMQIYFALDTLEYLARSGRIGRAARFLGTMLDMKPILSLKEGAIEPFDRVRSRAKATRQLVDMAIAACKGKPNVQLAVIHSACEEDGKKLLEELKNEINPSVTMFGELGPAVGVYTGPGVQGVCWYVPPERA